jgi:hypothetical protein
VKGIITFIEWKRTRTAWIETELRFNDITKSLGILLRNLETFVSLALVETMKSL